jgi:hypothetical protein
MLAVMVIALTACASSAVSTPVQSTTTSSRTGIVGATPTVLVTPAPPGTPGPPQASLAWRPANCQPPSTAQTSSTGNLEIHGTAPTGTELWALIFGDGLPLHTHGDTKIVWRMTGTGGIAFTANGPDGLQVGPSWGPDPHVGSSWDRPGDEWGTGFALPRVGCWEVFAVRGSTVGWVDLMVVA